MTRDDFERVYNENVSIVEGFLYARCRDRPLAEELTQETFCRALASLERYDSSCRISVWLCAIAKHTLYQHYARSRESDALWPTAPILPDELVIGRERARRLADAISALPAPMRDVVRLRAAQMSFAEIARRIGISEINARVTFHRAKKRLEQEDQKWR